MSFTNLSSFLQIAVTTGIDEAGINESRLWNFSLAHLDNYRQGHSLNKRTLKTHSTDHVVTNYPLIV